MSYGTQCAAMNGVPNETVQRAIELSEMVIRGEDLVTICAGVSEDEAEKLKTAEKVAREFMMLRLDDEVEGEIRDTLATLLRLSDDER